MDNMRVRLNADLTRYDSRLIVGSLGSICRPQSEWARNFDRFTGVQFDSGACLDVLWSSLDKVEEPAPKAEETTAPKRATTRDKSTHGRRQEVTS